MARLTLSQQVTNLQDLNASLQLRLSTANASFDAIQRIADDRAERIARLQSQVDLLPDLRTKVATLTKELTDAKTYKGYSDERATSASSEIEQAHAVLDAVEGCPGREYEVEGAYSKTKRQLVTRLAGAFLAIAKTGGAK